MRVTPSLPQWGRQPKGSIPLTPIYISPVSRGISHYSYEVSSLFFRDATSILGVPLQVRLMTKSAKSILAPPCLGVALRRGTLPEIDNFTNFHGFGSTLWLRPVSPQKFSKLPLCAPDTFFIPAHGECLPQCNPECLEQCLALVVVVFTGKCHMGGDTGPVAQAVKEMLEDVCRYVADCPVAK